MCSLLIATIYLSFIRRGLPDLIRMQTLGFLPSV